MYKEIELKTCPFCGSQPEIKINYNTLLAQVHCNKCGITIKRNYKDSVFIEELLTNLISEEWNRRSCNDN